MISHEEATFGDPTEERSRWRRVVSILDECATGWRQEARDGDNPVAWLGDAAVQAIREMVSRKPAPEHSFYVVKSVQPYVPPTYSGRGIPTPNAGYRNKMFATLAEAKAFALECASKYKAEYTVAGGSLIGTASPSAPPVVWTDAK